MLIRRSHNQTRIEMQIPVAHLLHSVPSQNTHSTLPTIEDAMKLYLKVKGENKQKTFFTHTRRSADYLIQCLGCHSLDQHSGADAAKFRDWLRNKKLSTASIQRNFFIGNFFLAISDSG